MRREQKNRITGLVLRWNARRWGTVVVTIAAALVFGACQQRTETTPVPPAVGASNPAPAVATSAPAPAAIAVNPALQKLVGQWLRADGGYILDIKSIDEKGQVQAAYLNPRPINISKAEARTDTGALRLFVELRDSGYPGCTYNLMFDPTSDTLVGAYFQAAMKEEFSVVFERQKQ